MKHAKPIKRALSVLLALVLSLSLVTPTWAAAKTQGDTVAVVLEHGAHQGSAREQTAQCLLRVAQPL